MRSNIRLLWSLHQTQESRTPAAEEAEVGAEVEADGAVERWQGPGLLGANKHRCT